MCPGETSNSLTADEVVSSLKEILTTLNSSKEKNSVQKDLSIDVILDLVKRNIEKAQNSSALASQMLETIKKISQLKVIEAVVPKSILPDGYSVALYDARIAGHGPDEKIYRNNKWIREHVTRGLTFMRISGKEKSLDFAIYANKKFTGGVGDEDECQPENNDIWREFCLQPPEHASQVICMTKLNGEAGHFSVRNIGGEFYIIAGSKNVHMLVKKYKDIDEYTDSRYLVARNVAKAVLNLFSTMEDSKVRCLQSFLHTSKMTVVCEILQPDYQHIVNLSHLKESVVHILMLAAVASSEQDSLTAIPPHMALGLAAAFELPQPEYESISNEEVQEKVVKMRGMRNSEGFVLYYLQGEQTIGLAKVKTAWYVMLRALREKVDYAFNGRKGKDTPLADRIKATHKRFAQIQKWIKFNDGYRKEWEILGSAFFTWISDQIRTKSLCPKTIRPKFPIIWAEFLADTGRTDEIHFEAT